MINIWWRGPDGVEKIDTAHNPREAAYLVREYRLAFHTEKVWAGRKKDEPTWEPKRK